MIDFLKEVFKFRAKHQFFAVLCLIPIFLLNFMLVRILETNEVKWTTDCTFSEIHKKGYPIFMCNKERVITNTDNDITYLVAEKKEQNPILNCTKKVGSMSERVMYVCSVKVSK